MALGLVLIAGCLASAQAVTGQVPVTRTPARQVAHLRDGTSLDERVKLLTEALDLDAVQQTELKKVLEAQRDQVSKVWSDTSVPAAYRISATRTISDETADRIRALLNDEQKKKYNPPKPPHQAAADSTSPSVEDWMNATKPR